MDQMLEETKTQSIKEKNNYRNLTPTELIELILEITNSKKKELYQRKRNNIPKLLTCYALHQLTPLTLTQIGKIMKLKFNTVSENSRRFKEQKETNKTYANHWKELCKKASSR
jgi:chromosomal replication initiation ATPase DnaA